MGLACGECDEDACLIGANSEARWSGICCTLKVVSWILYYALHEGRATLDQSFD